MNIEKIGAAAGAVWSELHKAGEARTLAALKKLPGFTSDEIVAALGWLAREGKIDFQVDKKRALVSLVENELCV